MYQPEEPASSQPLLGYGVSYGGEERRRRPEWESQCYWYFSLGQEDPVETAADETPAFCTGSETTARDVTM